MDFLKEHLTNDTPIYRKCNTEPEEQIENSLHNDQNINKSGDAQNADDGIEMSETAIEMDLQHANPGLQEQLFLFLHQRRIEEFIDFLQNPSVKNLIDCDDGEYTLLQYAVLHGLKDPVRALLSAEANPNKNTNHEKRPPIIIACDTNNSEILKLFLEIVPIGNLNVNVKNAEGKTALHVASMNQDVKCIEDLVRYGASVDAADAEGNTPLHLASRNKDMESAVCLLKHGSNYRAMNKFHKRAVSSDAFLAFLNKSLKVNDKQPEDKDYELTFDYEFLLVAKKEKYDSRSYQGNTSERPFSSATEMGLLRYYSKSEDYEDILPHPIIMSFVNIKYRQHRNKILLQHLIDAIILMVFIILFVKEKTGNHQNTGSYNVTEKVFIKIFQTILIIYLITISVLLTFKLFYSFRDFAMEFFNWLDLCFVISVSLSFSHNSRVLDVVIIFTSLSKYFKIGNSFFPTSLEILLKVSMNYGLWLLFYIPFIFSFAYSFYSIHNGNIMGQQNNTTDEMQEYYTSPWLSILKVFVMMMGEIDASEFLPQVKNYGISFWLILLFIFMMVLVLPNLLTGLAVRDINIINKRTIIINVKSRIALIYNLEKPLFVFNNVCVQFAFKKICRIILNRAIKKLILFPDRKSCCIRIYPNKSTKVMFDDGRDCDWFMDSAIIKNAMKILHYSSTDFDIKQVIMEIRENYANLNKRLDNLANRLAR